MRRILLAALALAVGAAPAVAHRDVDGRPADPPGPRYERPHADGGRADRPDAAAHRGPRAAHLVVRACVTADATAEGVELRVRGGNRHMRRALGGATTFTAALDADTRIRSAARARGGSGEGAARGPRAGTHRDLTMGDRVIVRFRAARGTAAADLPAATRVIDRGPGPRCAPPMPVAGPAPDPADEPAPEVGDGAADDPIDDPATDDDGGLYAGASVPRHGG